MREAERRKRGREKKRVRGRGDRVGKRKGEGGGEMREGEREGDFKSCAKKTGPKDSCDSFINSLCLTIPLI